MKNSLFTSFFTHGFVKVWRPPYWAHEMQADETPRLFGSSC